MAIQSETEFELGLAQGRLRTIRDRATYLRDHFVTLEQMLAFIEDCCWELPAEIEPAPVATLPAPFPAYLLKEIR